MILVVDDDKILTQLLRTLLEEAGYEVRVAYDGEEALEVFFVACLRGERRFTSSARLAAQIRRDVREAARRLRGGSAKKACEECFTKGRAVGYSNGPKVKTRKQTKARGRFVHG